MSKYLPMAIVASEDKNFYSHHGVDPGGILRAVFADVSAHRFVQGGSTITQQLAKNLFFADDQRTMAVKMHELFTAMQIEEHYSKSQILETYLNNVYFGNGTYGIEQASQRYFGKHAANVSLPEAAYLVGLVNAPSKLSADKSDALARQLMILGNMNRFGMIDDKTAASAEKVKLKIYDRQTDADRCSYYFAYVKAQLEQGRSEDDLYKKGVRAYTFLDATAQALAVEAITKGIRLAPKGVSQGALVSVSVADGGIIAMVGGAGSYLRSPWNRATSPHTAGSAFKPFVYLAGLLNGIIKQDTMLDDAPLAVQVPGSTTVYSPKNFDGKYMGPITVRKALALSRNTCAVRVGAAVGPDKIVDVARQAGITSKLDPTPSLSLGASAVSPLDMASAYATLARDGVRIQPRAVRRITTADGKILQDFQSKSEKVFPDEPVAELVDVLQDVVERGTARHAKLLGRPVAGKTGTADGARDIWFIGFTPDVSTAVWGGNDQNQAITGKQVTGGTIMAGIWQNYMQAYYAYNHTLPGSFAAPVNPLIREPEPLNFMPQPADIYGRVGQYANPTEIPVAPAPLSNGFMPPMAPQRQLQYTPSPGSAAPDTTPPPKKKSGIGKMFKKVFSIF
jgi:penicillin-binding protein 1A